MKEEIHKILEISNYNLLSSKLFQFLSKIYKLRNIYPTLRKYDRLAFFLITEIYSVFIVCKLLHFRFPMMLRFHVIMSCTHYATT